jgi:DNA-binding SARP family transcriptional activator
VVKYLAVAGDRGTEREEVIEAVWPERDPEKGRALLRTALSEIRRVLEPGRPPGEASAYLSTSADRVVLHATTDLAEARRLASAGEAAAALALFRDELLSEDPYADWAFDHRRAAGGLRLELADRVAADESAGMRVRTEALELLLAAEPWRDQLHNRLIGLHRSSGDEAAARAAERRRDA